MHRYPSVVIQVITKDDLTVECLGSAREERSSAFLNGGQQLEVVRFGGKVGRKHLTEMPEEHFSS